MERLNLSRSVFPMCCCLLNGFSDLSRSPGHTWLWPVQSPSARVHLRAAATVIIAIGRVWPPSQPWCPCLAQPSSPHPLPPPPTRAPGTKQAQWLWIAGLINESVCGGLNGQAGRVYEVRERNGPLGTGWYFQALVSLVDVSCGTPFSCKCAPLLPEVTGNYSCE